MQLQLKSIVLHTPKSLPIYAGIYIKDGDLSNSVD